MARAQTGELVVFELKKDLSATERTRFCREVWGYEEHSQFSKYRYWRPGLLSGIAHVKLTRGVVLVAHRDAAKVVRFLRKGARVQRRVVHLTARDLRTLSPKGPQEHGG